MIRNSVLASLVVLALSGFTSAGELDGERNGATVVPAQAATIKASGDVLGDTVRSEMDSESPAQAHFFYGARYRGFYGGGYAVGFRGYYGGGFGYSSYYGGGFPAYRSSFYYGGYPGFGGGYSYRAAYYAPAFGVSYYGGFRGGYCGW